MYPSTSLFIAIGQLAIIVLVLFSYPLQVLPCRDCLDKVFHAGHAQALVKPSEEGEDDEGADVGDEHGSSDMSSVKHAILTSVIIACGFTVAYFVDDLRISKYSPIL